ANDNRDYKIGTTGPLVGADGMTPINPAPSTRNSVGRKQPYAANPNLLIAQSPLPQNPPPKTPPPPQPANTFFRHNGRDLTTPLTQTFPQGQPAQTLDMPFDWLVHL